MGAIPAYAIRDLRSAVREGFRTAHLSQGVVRLDYADLAEAGADFKAYKEDSYAYNSDERLRCDDR